VHEFHPVLKEKLSPNDKCWKNETFDVVKECDLCTGQPNVRFTKPSIRVASQSGLPDGIFSYSKSQFYSIVEGLGKFGYISWSFGIFVLHFPRFGMLNKEKSGNPALNYMKC
jgi:hypothetical protein